MTRYECVDARKAEGSAVTAACEVAEVSTSGFYDWVERSDAEPTDRQVAEAELVGHHRGEKVAFGVCGVDRAVHRLPPGLV